MVIIYIQKHDAQCEDVKKHITRSILQHNSYIYMSRYCFLAIEAYYINMATLRTQRINIKQTLSSNVIVLSRIITVLSNTITVLISNITV